MHGMNKPLTLLEWVFPPQASAHAASVDWIYFALSAVTVVFTVGVALAILVLAVKYRRLRPDQVGEDVHESHLVELTWTVIPLILCLGLFYWGTKVYLDHLPIPEDAIEISVVGKQWMWKFQHPGGRREINNLHIPLGRKVHLRMISQDVIHSLFVPAFRMKQDVLPLFYTSTWFEAIRPGEFHLHCTEYCGKDHSAMGGTVYVMQPADYDRWLSSGTGMDAPPALPVIGAGAAVAPTGSAAVLRGRQVYNSMACASCHLTNGKGQGPSHVGIFGSRRQFADGSNVIADDNYIRESILNPSAKIVAGYAPVMPPYQGRVSEEEILDIIAFIKSEKSTP